MTYSINQKITTGSSTDTGINQFVSDGTPNFNKLWGTGTGDSGYGQSPVLSTVAAKDKVKYQVWLNLINNIEKIAAHQGTDISTTPMTNAGGGSITGNKKPARNIPISVLRNIATNLSSINTNRLNAVAHGNDIVKTTTSTSTWRDRLVATITVAFSNDNAVRFFFNAGGQIGINASHPNYANTGVNQLISDICSDMGTLWISSPASGTVTLYGSSFNGITKVGGAAGGSGSTLPDSNYGYHKGWTTTDKTILTQYGTFAFVGPTTGLNYTNGTFGQISLRYDGAGIITITVLLDEVPNGYLVTTGTSITAIVRPPSTTNLTSAWGSAAAGTLTVTNTITIT